MLAGRLDAGAPAGCAPGAACVGAGWARDVASAALAALDAAPVAGRAGLAAALDTMPVGVRGVAVTDAFAGAVAAAGAALPLPLPLTFPIPDAPFPIPGTTRNGLPARSSNTSRPRSSLAAGISSPIRKAWVSSG